jgi:hypothetical protein
VIRGGGRPGLFVAVAFALAGCATVAPAPRKLPDGSYQLACSVTLATCLQAFETVCAWHGYDVISGTERRRRADLRDVPEETITSEAQVRCKAGEALFGGSPAAAAPPPALQAAGPTAPALRPAPTAEPRSVAAPATVCSATPADGGAPTCGGPSSTTSGAPDPR